MRIQHALFVALAIGSGSLSAAPALKLLLPLERTAYQTNEQIDLSVVRSAAEALTAGELALTATGADGSKLAFTFPVAAVAVEGGAACATEHLHLNGALLRPAGTPSRWPRMARPCRRTSKCSATFAGAVSN